LKHVLYGLSVTLHQSVHPQSKISVYTCYTLGKITSNFKMGYNEYRILK